MRIGMH